MGPGYVKELERELPKGVHSQVALVPQCNVEKQEANQTDRRRTAESFQEELGCAKTLWHLIASCVVRGIWKLMEGFKRHAKEFQFYKPVILSNKKLQFHSQRF